MNTGKWPFIVLVKFATRGRVDRFFAGMDSIYNLCSQPDYIRVLITADTDDSQMNTEEVRQRISKYKNAHIIYGESKNKIHATNRDLDNLPEGWNNWDIIANFSDDQRFTIFGWDEMIRIDFNSVSPDFSHYIAYLDPDTHGALSTLFIAGRKFVDFFGWIYDPQFLSLFCDNLSEDCAKAMGKYHYTGYSIYQHFNPSYGYQDFKPDQMYLEQQRIGWDIDQKTYYKIKEQGIDNYILKFLTK